MSLRAAIYLRVSTEEQGDKNLSIPFQTDACHALAERNGWTLADDYIDIASGKTDRREAFQRLIADGRAKLFDVVVVYKYSRFARDDIDSVWYERELNKKGINLVSATEVLDATTSTGWLNKRILQTFAEFENRQRAEFTKAGMRQKVVQGEWPWKAPLGYVNRSKVVSGRRTRSWVEPDPSTAPAISRLFDEAATGRYSMPELADLAAEMGLTRRSGFRFTSERILHLLRNPFYKGVVAAPSFDLEVAGVHEALVDQELWDQVQLKLAIRGKAPYRAHRHKHLLRGLMRCACGLAMTAEFHDGGRNAYLRCMSSANRRYAGCGQMGPRLDAIIGQVEEEILPSLWVSDADLTLVRKELKGLLQNDRHALEAEVHILRTRLAHLKNRSKTLLDLRLDGEISRDEFQEKRVAIEVEQGTVTRRLEQSTSVIAQGEEDLESALRVANQLPLLWSKADVEGRRGILEAVFVRFVVDQKRIVDMDLRPPYSWLVRWKPQRDREMPDSSAVRLTSAAD